MLTTTTNFDAKHDADKKKPVYLIRFLDSDVVFGSKGADAAVPTLTLIVASADHAQSADNVALTQANTLPASGLYLCYDLASASGSSVTDDGTGGNDATLVGSPTIVSGEGVVLNGSQYVDANTTLQAQFRDDFTLSIPIKPDDGQPSYAQSIFGAYTIPDRFRVFLATDGSLDIDFRVDNVDVAINIGQTLTGFSNGAQSEFTTIGVVVKRDESLSVFVNGELATTPTDISAWSGYQELYTSAVEVSVGMALGTGDYFEGRVGKKVRFYTAAATAAQMLAMHNADNPDA